MVLATHAVRTLCADADPKAQERTIAIVVGMPCGTPGATNNMLRLVTPRSVSAVEASVV